MNNLDAACEIFVRHIVEIGFTLWLLMLWVSGPGDALQVRHEPAPVTLSPVSPAMAWFCPPTAAGECPPPLLARR